MNRFHVIVLVLFSLFIQQAHCMLMGYNTQARLLKKLYTKEKCEKESQKFLSSFGQYSINETGSQFCGLPRNEQVKIFSCLSPNQKSLVWFATQNLGVRYLTTLCNGNQKVAILYSQKPISEILEAYAHAKEMMKWCPIDSYFTEEHYMVLKDSQANILNEVTEKKIIHSCDIPKCMSALKLLKDIDPEVFDIGAIKEITD